MYVLQKETGWTDDYLLWEVSWMSLQLKLADAPRYESGDNKKTKTIVDEQELANILKQADYGTG